MPRKKQEDYNNGFKGQRDNFRFENFRSVISLLTSKCFLETCVYVILHIF